MVDDLDSALGGRDLHRAYSWFHVGENPRGDVCARMPASLTGPVSEPSQSLNLFLCLLRSQFAVHMFNNPNMTPTDEAYYEMAKTNYKSWNDALKTKNADNVIVLYENGADLSFLPAKSPIMIEKVNDGVESKNGNSLEDVKDYFTAFLKKDPDGTVVDEVVMGLNTYPLNLDGAAYLHSGVYRFKLDSKDDNTIRFSFVWKKAAGGAWKIQHHHSSYVAKPGLDMPKWVTELGA
jgi:hypothetical protein